MQLLFYLSVSCFTFMVRKKVTNYFSKQVFNMLAQKDRNNNIWSNAYFPKPDLPVSPVFVRAPLQLS